MSRGWLIVFAKAPRAGLVKTRLSPPLTLEQAALCYDAMLGDVLEATLEDAARLDLEPVLAFHPPDAVPDMLKRAPAGYRLCHQRGRDLSERMANAFAEAGAAGAALAVLRGSDSPLVAHATIADMVSRLEAGADVVFTPDRGGGYAMVGQRRHVPALFEVAMSTDRVLEETLALAARHGLDHACTQASLDVDRAEDLTCFDEVSDPEALDRCARTVGLIAEWRRGGVL